MVIAEPNSDIERLKADVQKDQPDSSRLSKLQKIAEYYAWTDTNSALAVYYTNKAIALAGPQGLAKSFKLTWLNAQILTWQEKYLEAYYEITRVKGGSKPVMTPAEGLRFDLLFAVILKKIGALYDAKQMYEYFLSERSFPPEKKLEILLETGRICYDLTEQNAALNYFSQAVDLAASLKNYGAMADGYNGIGSISAVKKQDYKSAIGYFSLALDYALKSSDSLRIMYSLRRKAWYNYSFGNKDSAMADYFRLITYAKKLNSPEYLANAYSNLCGIFRGKKDYKRVLEYYNLGAAAAIPQRDWYHLSAMYDEVSLMYEAQGDFEKAYRYCRLFNEYADSSRELRQKNEYVDSRVKYETDKKEKELANMASSLTQHKYLMYALAASLVLVIIIGLLLYRQSRMNALRKLSEMNHQLSEITQKNLRQQMNPHFIFNTLNSIQYYMYQHDAISTNTYLNKFSRLMRRILENSEQTAVPVQDELDALQLYLELEQLRFKDKFQFSVTVDENIDALDYKIPTMFIQPLVENAICHGLMHKESGGQLSISMALRDQNIECSIEDNGVGREAAKEINRKKDRSHQSLGTKITQARLDLVNSLYGRNMSITYTDLKNADGSAAGTKVVINIPVIT